MLKSNIKEFREEKGLTQIELADLIGVSRQTIYYLEKGDYNPSLTLSFKIAEVLKKPLNKIFFLEPIIKSKLESLSLKEVKNIAESINIDYNRLVSLSEIDEKDLSKDFDKELLRKISTALNLEYEDTIQE
ncbi:MAG: helix-turn-helix transcriptional regulator [Candidatus Lokiarchaeota archaeon]|nr:helix-turn-helix transcriptional regulator [Candidatus Lokiarchaeota archaeon]